MSISPPTDIVLDVARAADPVRRQDAVARLSQLSGPRGAEATLATSGGIEPFGAVFDELAPDAPAPEGDAFPSPVIQLPFDVAGTLNRLASDTAAASRGGASAEALQHFESMVLATFVGTMLPQDSGGLFGTGSAGQMWQSFLAQQIAGEMAKAGGIGIAETLARSAAAEPAGGAA